MTRAPLGLALALACGLAGAADPVARPGSPAWRDLMAQRVGAAPASELAWTLLLRDWGQQAGAERLERELLEAHLLRLAGASRPAALPLRELLVRPSVLPPLAARADAYARAWADALALTLRPEALEREAAGAWRLLLRHRGAEPLAPASLRVQPEAGDWQCQTEDAPGVLMPGAGLQLRCRGAAPPQLPGGLRFTAPDFDTPAQAQAMAARLAAHARPQLAPFLARHAGCEALGNCAPPARKAKPPFGRWLVVGAGLALLLAAAALWWLRASGRRSAPRRVAVQPLAQPSAAPTPPVTPPMSEPQSPRVPVPPGARPACPRCRQPMAHLALQGHYGAQVELDSCADCRLVWFDAMESVRLSGLGWAALLRELAQIPSHQPVALALPPQCPRCSEPLQHQHNRTRFGRYTQWACGRGHGHGQAHGLLLAERGLFRSLLAPERQALAREGRQLDCLHCGAPLDGALEHCSHCTGAVVVVDLPRLAQALHLGGDGSGMRAGQPSLRQTAAPDLSERQTWQCHACGAALNPTLAPQCPQCSHPVLVPTLADLGPLLDQAEQ